MNTFKRKALMSAVLASLGAAGTAEFILRNDAGKSGPCPEAVESRWYTSAATNISCVNPLQRVPRPGHGLRGKQHPGRRRGRR